MSSLLRLCDVSAGYAQHVNILSEVSMTAESGTITGIVGLNGAGKSTLMKVITGFLTPRSGHVLFDGEDQTELAPHRGLERGIVYVPQDLSLFPGLSVRDNLELPLAHLNRRGFVTKAEARGRLEEVMTRYPILRKRQRSSAGRLNGGQQKILEFARVHLQRPRLFLVDEPSIGLAPNVAEQVYELISPLPQEGMTVVIVDHNIRRLIELSSSLYGAPPGSRCQAP